MRDAAADTWVATAAELGTAADGRVDLVALLRALHARERRHVLLEGGPPLAGAMVAAGLVDRVVAYLAPTLLGSGPASLEGGRCRHAGRRHRLELVDVRRVGADVRLEARPALALCPVHGRQCPG